MDMLTYLTTQIDLTSTTVHIKASRHYDNVRLDYSTYLVHSVIEYYGRPSKSRSDRWMDGDGGNATRVDDDGGNATQARARVGRGQSSSSPSISPPSARLHRKSCMFVLKSVSFLNKVTFTRVVPG